jgi:hypothetical protein
MKDCGGGDSKKLLDQVLWGDGVVWPVFDGAVRAAAARRMYRFWPECGKEIAMMHAADMLDGRFWCTLENAALCMRDCWRMLCHSWEGWGRFAEHEQASEACIVYGFVRAGMTLRAPLAPADAASFVSPLLIAVAKDPTFLAKALLDLPPAFGLDINFVGPATASGVAGSALGCTNSATFRSPELYGLLLMRTDREIVSGGLVHVDRGGDQMYRADTHVLISNIFLCTNKSAQWGIMGADMAHLFIAAAQTDGGGTDLTAGVAASGAREGDHTEIRFEPHVRELWPDGQFGGALVLVDLLWRWYTGKEKDGHDLLRRIESVRDSLILAMRRIRAYRRMFYPTIARPLSACARDLHKLVAAYALVPLCNEAQLDNPLLSEPALVSTATPNPLVSEPALVSTATPNPLLSEPALVSTATPSNHHETFTPPPALSRL